MTLSRIQRAAMRSMIIDEHSQRLQSETSSPATRRNQNLYCHCEKR
jgi:hypothetical protein